MSDQTSDRNLSSSLAPLMRRLLLMIRYCDSADLHSPHNPLTKFGAKVYSQNDEDGITFEILRRLAIANGKFAEFGVGDGTENNTLALAAAGWNGFWIGNQELAFNPDPDGLKSRAFSYRKAWITKSNIVELYRNGLAAIGVDCCDVISLDLDGNDYHFVETLLEAGASPELFIVEYNAKFMPPIRFLIDYDEQHQWAGDDYFGASLSAFCDLFASHGYFLTCCNVTGSNAFFVKETYRDRFTDIPARHELIYTVPRYFLTGLDAYGHPKSVKAIEGFFRKIHAAAARKS